MSVIQTKIVVDRILQKNSGLKIDLKLSENSEDHEHRRSLVSLQQRGLFDKEVDQLVLEGRADFAVHSMKDVPVDERFTRLVIASVPERGSPAEVLVSRYDLQVKDLPQKSRIGASSPIRAAQLRRIRPDIKTEPLFGPAEERVERMDRGEFDGIVLGEAGLARLGLSSRISERLSTDDFTPVPGQGTLAIVARRDNLRVIDVLRSIEHQPSRVEAEAERELIRTLEEPIKVPVGGLASARGDQISVKACVLSMNGGERLSASKSSNIREGVKIAREIGEELLGKGAGKLAESWRRPR